MSRGRCGRVGIWHSFSALEAKGHCLRCVKSLSTPGSSNTFLHKATDGQCGECKVLTQKETSSVETGTHSPTVREANSPQPVSLPVLSASDSLGLSVSVSFKRQVCSVSSSNQTHVEAEDVVSCSSIPDLYVMAATLFTAMCADREAGTASRVHVLPCVKVFHT